MSGLSLGMKVERLVRFLNGVSSRRVMKALGPFGFGPARLEEGWDHVRKQSAARLMLDDTVTESTEVAAVDAWENKWYPIIEAALFRHAPNVHKKVFLNMARTDGLEALIAVRELVRRLDEVAAAPDAESVAATAVLAERGVTAAVREEAKSLLAAAEAPKNDASDDDIDAARAAIDAAEQALWAYYLEWSTIARTAIKDRKLLRSLGFLARKSASGEEEIVDDAAPSGVPASPNGPAGGALPVTEPGV